MTKIRKQKQTPKGILMTARNKKKKNETETKIMQIVVSRILKQN